MFTGNTNSLPFEERAGGDFDAHDAAAAETPSRDRPGALITSSNLDHVFPVFILTHEQQLLQVLRLATRLMT